jgi:hypothetical protein
VLSRRIPLPECFLHYNTNNEDSSAGWLRHGFSPLLGTTESLDDDIATVRVRYERLVVALHGCMIFRASHLDEKHSATMYKKIQFQVEDHASVLPPPRTYENDAWYADFESELPRTHQAEVPSHPMYLMNDDEIEAKYERKPGDTQMLGVDGILEMAYFRKKYCVNTEVKEKPVDEDTDADDEGDEDSGITSSSDDETPDGEKKPKASNNRTRKKATDLEPVELEDWQADTAPTTSDSSSWRGTSDDTKAYKKRKHKETKH